MPLKAVVDNLDNVAPQFHELYVERNGKFEIGNIEGIRTQGDIDRLQSSLVKERNDHKITKDKFAPFAELDITDIQAKLDRIPELEAAASGKLDETKISELVETRIKGRIAPIERELNKAKGELTLKDEIINGFTTKERNRTISTAISIAARKAGVQDSAIDDAVLLGERIFDVDETGAVVVKDQVGFTPGVDPTVWFSELQPKRAHWWPASSGGGATGTGGRQGGATNPWSADNWNMTEQSAIFRTNPVLAGQLAKSAGTTIGGPKPKAKN